MTRFPAEWEPQSAVLIAWPHRSGDFSRHLNEVEESYAFIAKTISQYEKLIIACRDDEHQEHIQTWLPTHDPITYIQARLNDIWVRDTAFLSVEIEGNTRLLNFRFNGWGNKYTHQEDNALNHKLISHPSFAGNSHQDIEFILEGGSVESDGAGTLLTTPQCLLNPNRNKDCTQTDIEEKLNEYLGAKRVLWLNQPNLAGDDTDAHIDTLARFCPDNTIAYTSCRDNKDRHYRSLQNMEEQLRTFRTMANEPYRLVDLPLPQPIFDELGDRLPANYANFLVINKAVLVPAYNDPMDTVAAERLAQCFPGRNIILTPSRPLVLQYGSVHCMTMQFPENVVYKQVFN